MIMPSKHLSPRQSLLGVSGIVLTHLERPHTVTGLWNKVQNVDEVRSFEQFALAVDLLYAMGALDIRDGFVHKIAS